MQIESVRVISHRSWRVDEVSGADARAVKRMGGIAKPSFHIEKAAFEIDKEEGVVPVTKASKDEKIGEREYELRLFEGYEFHADGKTFEVGKSNKTINEGCLPLDPGVENKFARDCESRDDIEFYFKLPPRFKLKTHIGPYNPDWALIKRGETTVYFVAETKSKDELRAGEAQKIHFGAAHCEQLSIDFKRVEKVADLDEPVRYG